MIYTSWVLCWFGFSIRALYGFLLIWLCKECLWGKNLGGSQSAQQYTFVFVYLFVCNQVTLVPKIFWLSLANQIPHPDDVWVSNPQKIFSRFVHYFICVLVLSRFTQKRLHFWRTSIKLGKHSVEMSKRSTMLD